LADIERQPRADGVSAGHIKIVGFIDPTQFDIARIRDRVIILHSRKKTFERNTRAQLDVGVESDTRLRFLLGGIEVVIVPHALRDHRAPVSAGIARMRKVPLGQGDTRRQKQQEQYRPLEWNPPASLHTPRPWLPPVHHYSTNSKFT